MAQTDEDLVPLFKRENVVRRIERERAEAFQLGYIQGVETVQRRCEATAAAARIELESMKPRAESWRSGANR